MITRADNGGRSFAYWIGNCKTPLFLNVRLVANPEVMRPDTKRLASLVGL